MQDGLKLVSQGVGPLDERRGLAQLIELSLLFGRQLIGREQ